MALSYSLLSEEQFLCPICLEVFTEPVTTLCGHNFCISCLTKYWDNDVLCQCPMCKKQFHTRPELRVNTMFREVVENFKSMRGRAKDESPVKSGKVPCDVCTGMKLQALKSCLVCLASYCEAHLKPHQSAPAFQRHKLIDPVENLEDRICEKHDRLLELFCRTDQTCVCQFCTETDHKTHETVPIEEECRLRRTQLRRTEVEVQRIIQERRQKVEEIQLSVNLSERNTVREIAESIQVFTSLLLFIEKSQAELIELIEARQKAVERQAQGLIEELEHEITQLQGRSTELDQVSLTGDNFQFLQSFPSLVYTPPNVKNWSEISLQGYLCVETVRKAASQLNLSLNEEIEKLPGVKLKRIRQYAVDVTLDPDTANPQLILSEDGKQVKYGVTEKNGNSLNVFGKDAFFSGRVYYEVKVKNKTEWTLGVARKSTDCKLSPDNGLWAVILRNGNEYQACDLTMITLTLGERPQKVGVFVDYEEGLVSFYDVKAMSHIYSFTGCTFKTKVYPYFNPRGNKNGQNSAPLIISPVIHK